MNYKTLSSFNVQTFLRTLTSRPGVYHMLDEAGTVLYVGKARNLKKRVSSYFNKTQDSPKTRVLVKQIGGINVTITHTEAEALLLESNLIKTLKPRYNILFRDDKSYPYLYLSNDQEFARLSFYRGGRRGKGRYFGPYPSAKSARRTLNLVQKLFRIRQCEDSFFKNRSRPCLQHQIKRCTAPCVGYIGPEKYHQDIRHAAMFLEGRNEDVIEALNVPMQEAAESLEYERAAQYRDQIISVRKIQETQYISSAKGELDIIACHVEAGLACVQVFYIRAGNNLGNKAFFPRHAKNEMPEEIISAFLTQYYFSQRRDRQIPRAILLSHQAEDTDILEKVLTEQSGRAVKISQPLRGDRSKWVEMARQNAAIALQQRIATSANYQQRFDALRELVNTADAIERIECFDISHTAGEATVASCVAFNSEGALKGDYRHFNINHIQAGDDYAAMRQVIERRYARVKKEEGRLPDIILIDGGVGQISSAAAALQELQLDEILLIGVAKGPGRKPGLETLVLSDGQRKKRLPSNSPALHLIQEIRDEAHRFAITAHRQRRKKQRTTSPLERIAGIGSKRRQALIKHFGGMQGITRAGVDDLAKVSGINKNLAQKIYDRFH